MNGNQIWIIKKNNIFYQNALRVGLKMHYHYCDKEINAKFFDQVTDAQLVCKKLNNENAVDKIEGIWKVIDGNKYKGTYIK